MKNGLSRRFAVIVALGLVAAPIGARADDQQLAQAAPPPPPPAQGEGVGQAGEHFARGVKLYQEDDFQTALIEFKRAYELAPTWAVLYNMGQSQYQLRDYAAALRTLERYVREGGAQIPADRRTQVDREIGELRGRVAHVTLLSNVDEAEITLDDAPLGKPSASEVRLISAGRHKLAASKPGFVATSKAVDLAGGDTLSIRLDLTPEAQAAPPVERESPNYTGAFVGGAVGIAGVAVGTIFGVMTLNAKSALDGECNTAKVCVGSNAQNDIDNYSRSGTISGVGFGVGAVGLVLGAYFYFHARSKEGATTQSRMAPWVGPGAAGLSASF
jgi:hypothetical protein